ncbi:MAG: hypothetical protein JXR23_04790, partial [Pontiellaceae bacterium]|nr:hypothetical protein [Pontiellaceae bacterium]
NPHGRSRGILSPLCLPISPPGQGLSYRSGINNHLRDAKTIKKEGDSLIFPSDRLTITVDFI